MRMTGQRASRPGFVLVRRCARIYPTWGCPNSRAAAVQLKIRYPTGVRQLGFRALRPTNTFSQNGSDALTQFCPQSSQTSAICVRRHAASSDPLYFWLYVSTRPARSRGGIACRRPFRSPGNEGAGDS